MDSSNILRWAEIVVETICLDTQTLTVSFGKVKPNFI
jgi:hypothetical protein